MGSGERVVVDTDEDGVGGCGVVVGGVAGEEVEGGGVLLVDEPLLPHRRLPQRRGTITHRRGGGGTGAAAAAAMEGEVFVRREEGKPKIVSPQMKVYYNIKINNVSIKKNYRRGRNLFNNN